MAWKIERVLKCCINEKQNRLNLFLFLKSKNDIFENWEIGNLLIAFLSTKFNFYRIDQMSISEWECKHLHVSCELFLREFFTRVSITTKP